ncbi:MAG: hypothetical protein GX444_07720 [Myxococcales bacterium]|nr:hypothetical protein [Myxococcales bacterium]
MHFISIRIPSASAELHTIAGGLGAKSWVDFQSRQIAFIRRIRGVVIVVVVVVVIVIIIVIIVERRVIVVVIIFRRAVGVAAAVV